MVEVQHVGGDPSLCCAPGAWDRMTALPGGFAIHGEPLPREVADVAAAATIEPHALDWHVEAIHGYEPHDDGYMAAVVKAAVCLMYGGCE